RRPTDAGGTTGRRHATGGRDCGEANGPRETAARGQAHDGRRGPAGSERDTRRVCGDSEVRPAGKEELDRRGSVHVALPKVPAAPDVFEELDERVMIVCDRRLVRGLRGRPAKSHGDEGRAAVPFVV